MKVYANDTRLRVKHIIDRRPKSQTELKYIISLIGNGLVRRKSNGWYTWLSDVKVKNFDWYE